MQDFREPDHAQAVVWTELGLQEGRASLKKPSVLKHRGGLHQRENQLHCDADGPCVYILYYTRKDVIRNTLEVYPGLLGLQEAAAEHSVEVGAAGHQNIAVTWELFALRAKNNISENVVLPQGVQLQEEG